MTEISARIKDKYGMHARPALKIKLIADEYPRTSIEIVDPETRDTFNAKSIMELMTMAKNHDDEVIVRTSGDREKEAAERTVKLISEFDIDD